MSTKFAKEDFAARFLQNAGKTDPSSGNHIKWVDAALKEVESLIAARGGVNTKGSIRMKDFTTEIKDSRDFNQKFRQVFAKNTENIISLVELHQKLSELKTLDSLKANNLVTLEKASVRIAAKHKGKTGELAGAIKEFVSKLFNSMRYTPVAGTQTGPTNREKFLDLKNQMQEARSKGSLDPQNEEPHIDIHRPGS